MSKFFCFFLLFTCAAFHTPAQVNFVHNPDLELYDSCPTDWNQVSYARWWSSTIDTSGKPLTAMEYYNSCAGTNIYASVPNNISFYQSAHSGNGLAGAVLFYDETLPRPLAGVLPDNYRDYLQGRLIKPLTAGKNYCISFWVNLAEESAYKHNQIGAYLDDGSINYCGLPPGTPLTFVTPQIVSLDVIDDTGAWMKIEGSFIATGNETHITIGCFAKTDSVTYDVFPGSWTYMTAKNSKTGWNASPGISYYLIDDISVIPIDLSANAGDDTWVRKGDSVLIGRVNDTTAIGLDCKWYHRGSLIDSGAKIWAKGYGLVGDKDTYSVVQTICGVIKTDTVVVYTASVGIHEIPKDQLFNIYPNPSDGDIWVSSNGLIDRVTASLFDLNGRIIQQQQLSFSQNSAQLHFDAPPGLYMLQLTDDNGNQQKLKLIINPQH